MGQRFLPTVLESQLPAKLLSTSVGHLHNDNILDAGNTEDMLHGIP